MTVDMAIEFWQTKECALVAIEELIDLLGHFKGHVKYEEKMTELLETKKELENIK